MKSHSNLCVSSHRVQKCKKSLFFNIFHVFSRRTTMKRAFIVIGIESSGNHLILSLLSRMTIGGVAVFGTDLADLEKTQGYRYHEFEAFNAAWLGEKKIDEIAQGRHFVTGRSYPCGDHYPDVAAFYSQCVQLNYDPIIVVISRDKNIIELSTRNSNHPEKNIEVKIAKMVPILTSGMRVRFISFEALFLWGQHYLSNWLAEEGTEFQIDEKWVGKMSNANKKYINSTMSAPDLKIEAATEIPLPRENQG